MERVPPSLAPGLRVRSGAGGDALEGAIPPAARPLRPLRPRDLPRERREGRPERPSVGPQSGVPAMRRSSRRPHPRCRAPLSMNGEGLLEGLRFTTSCQVIVAPLHSWFTSGHNSQNGLFSCISWGHPRRSPTLRTGPGFGVRLHPGQASAGARSAGCRTGTPSTSRPERSTLRKAHRVQVRQPAKRAPALACPGCRRTPNPGPERGPKGRSESLEFKAPTDLCAGVNHSWRGASRPRG